YDGSAASIIGIRKSKIRQFIIITMNQKNKLTIGLFGFGVVGEGIFKVLLQHPSLNATVKKICIKHPDKIRDAPTELFTTDYNELLSDPEINLIVELIND